MWRRVSLPVALAGVCALAVILVRPPLPVDETRYLEVFRETLAGNPMLLFLGGEPYAEKTPLLFWLARCLTALGCPFQLALRSIPALAAAGTVLATMRLGRRVGLELAGWLQAALLLPFLIAQFLLFDSLLACAVWWTLVFWVDGRDRATVVAASFAFLAKGPVALLFLAPFFWALAPLQPVPRSGPRAAGLLALGLVPLACWAIGASLAGGPDFAGALLWDRWAGRIAGSTAHAKPFYTYLPVVLVGALPCTALLFARDSTPGESWRRRTLVCLVGIFLAFSLISGKQPHYLVPLAPAVALIGAWHVERTERGLARLRLGLRIELALAGLLLIAAFVALQRVAPPAGATSWRTFRESAVWPFPLVWGFALLAVAAGATFFAQKPRALLTASIAGLAAGTLALHFTAGQILHPHVLRRALDVSPSLPVARFGSSKHGLFNYLARRIAIDELNDVEELELWTAAHPGGRIVIEPELLPAEGRERWEFMGSDVVQSEEFQVLRVRTAR